MKHERSDDLWLDEQLEVSFVELAKLSGLSEAELRDLVDSGALIPNNPREMPWTFSGRYVVTVRSVCRLRDDFDLDANALSLSLLMLERIHELETELCELRAKAPRFF